MSPAANDGPMSSPPTEARSVVSQGERWRRGDDLRERGVVPVPMQDLQIVPDRAGGDQTVGGGADHETAATDGGFEVEGASGAEDLDPDRGVDQDHEARFRPLRSRRISERSPSQRPDPRSSRIWRALARRTKSSSARMTAAE